MNYNCVVRQILFIFTIILFVSCDNDSNEIGASIIGKDNFGFGTPADYRVTAYNQDLGAVASSDLPVNPLGIYNNPIFGELKAHFVTQVQLATENPTINPLLNQQVTSVVLTIPYFTKKLSTDSNGIGTYEIDSLYGGSAPRTKIEIYESGFYMSGLTTDAEPQLFYTDQFPLFDAAVGPYKGRLNNSADPSQNDAFLYSDFVETKTDTVLGLPRITEVSGPRMKLYLDNAFFQQKLFSPGAAGQLVNNNVFRNYFRGLFFKAGYSGSETPNLAMLNFAGGVITVNYKELINPDDNNPDTVDPTATRSIVLNLTGRTASLLEQNNVPPAYTSALSGANPLSGDRKLYIKGGQGSMAVINLFTELGDLQKLRSENLLLNEANLTFTIDRDQVSPGSSGPVEPTRLYLYDLNNRRPLVDYSLDQTADVNYPKLGKTTHDGIIQKSSDGRGTKYKVRITNHLIRLLNNADSTNVKLGLVVTENINVVTNKKLKNQSGPIKEVPSMSVAHPFGTVLYGSNIPVGDPDYDKRLKLEIYYTKPN